MRKKLFSIILSLALLTALFIPANAFADDTQDGLTIVGTETTDYEYSANTFTIKNGGSVTLSGTTSTVNVAVEAGATASITLDGVSIESSGSALDIGSSSNVTLTLTGTNELTSTGTAAALRVPSDSTLTLSGTGSLTATASTGAAIGGNDGEGGGNITISSGRITATSTGTGAGIGGGNTGAGGSILINGGTVTATSASGSGIGGGANGTAGSCKIVGGSVNANIAPQVTNADGSVNAYLTTLTLNGISSTTAMNSLSISGMGYSYGMSGAYTTASGVLNVYLPEGAQTTMAEVSGPTRYYGSVTTTTNPATSLGTLHAASLTINTGQTELAPATIGDDTYSQQIDITYYGEHSASIDFTVESGSLPTGLSLNQETGVISGEVTDSSADQSSPHSFTIKADDGNGNSDTQLFDLEVNGGLTIATDALTSGTVGSAYSFQVEHTYAGSSPTITYGATGLPDGLSMDTNGLITGTPTTATGSPFSVVITATATLTSETANRTLQLAVSEAPVLEITTGSLPAGTVGTAYDHQMVHNYTGSGTVSYSSSTLPVGLSISASGRITGTPTTNTGSPFDVTISATDGTLNDSASLSLTINPAAPVLNITTTTLPAAMVGVSYMQTINCTYTGGHTVSYSATDLPAGLTISTAGLISGTPTTSTGSPFSVQITATDVPAGGTLTDTATIQLTVNPATSLVITTDSLVTGEVGKAYSQTIAKTYSGSGTVTFGAAGLPSGLTINASTGIISGTPAWDTNLASPYLVTITATDGTLTHQKTLSLAIIKKYEINASAGTGGTITPSGTLYIQRYSNQTFTIKANSGYRISSVTVDGVNKGAISSYTFSNIIDPHTISVKFKSTSGSSSSNDDDSYTSTYTMRTLADTASGVMVSGSGVHKSATLKVEDIKLMAEGESAGSDAIRARLADDRYVVVFQKNLSLSHAFTGTLTITIPVDPQYNGQILTILHDKKGTAETLTATVSNGKAIFTVTSLSPFAAFIDLHAMATPTPAPTLVPTPEPTPTIMPTPLPTATPEPKNSASSLFLWLLGGIIVLALAVTIFVRLRNR